MITLTIDRQTIQVPPETTVLQAARTAGIEIPTLCYREGFEPSTSCMLCVVEVEGYSGLMPSCALMVEEGMKVHTDTPAVQAARRAALELLLSDHIGDCEGPCRSACPARMDIPRMIRCLAAGQWAQAIKIIKRDIALPAVLGRICPAPCEKVCRRARQDGPVSICLLKRFAADKDLRSQTPYRPLCKPASGKKAAIVGAGPCGLSAAYTLAQQGHQCVILEKTGAAGGMLRADGLRPKLPLEILEQEMGLIFDLGISFCPNTMLGRDLSLEELCRRVDAVFLAMGEPSGDGPLSLPIQIQGGKIVVDRSTFQTSMKGVFAGGGAIGSRQMCVKAVADGKEAAWAIHQFLTQADALGKQEEFHSRLGTLTEEEWQQYIAGADERRPVEPANPDDGFTEEEAMAEAGRCLHCDCGKKKSCKLRRLSTELKAAAGTYKGQRRKYARAYRHPEAVFESGKCIQCGLCVQALMKNGIQEGLTFQGRGFTMQISAALNGPVEEAAGPAARSCVQVCPTGAWSLKNK